MLFEIHQPIGHLQVGNIKDDAGIAKGGGIFTMGVDHDDVTLWRCFTNPVENERSTGRFTRTG
jgi:hypothetical protein